MEDWYASRELNKRLNFDNTLAGLDRFWKWITNSEGVDVAGPDLLKRSLKYFRGQSKSWYGFTSSLYRLCKTEVGQGRVDEAHLSRAESAVIGALRQEGMGRRMTDGELLMVCQHHSVPTRLIDISTRPLEALFFAVETEDGVDGRLFVVAPHQVGSNLPGSRDKIKLSRPDGSGENHETIRLPWADSVRGKKQSHGSWSADVALIDEEPLDPRMRAQAGKFLVGGVHRAHAGLNMPSVSNTERPDISSVAVNFSRHTEGKKLSQSWKASGWSVRIHAAWKPELRKRLASPVRVSDGSTINADSMYPPIAQIERLGRYVARAGARQVSG